MAEYLTPVQLRAAGDFEIATNVQCDRELFKMLLSQHGKVFRLESISYTPAEGIATLVWVPQKAITLVEHEGVKDAS